MSVRHSATFIAATLVAISCADVQLVVAEMRGLDVKRGFDIAAGRCSRCHAIGRDDPSPQRSSIPFRELHTRFPVEMLDEALRSGSIAGHDEMPGFDLGQDDVRALLSYIDSLVPGGPTYIGGQPK